VKRRVVRTFAPSKDGADERRLAKLDRLADGQFSCDTGLSRSVACSAPDL
jgi:hypothetical protein